MKPGDASHDLAVRAAQALKALLQEISTVKVREIRQEPTGGLGKGGLTAYVDVFGHCHQLACEIQSDGQPRQLRSVFEQMRAMPAGKRGDATPVIIAPYLSPEAQEICKQNQAGFLDLEGNARLSVGEVFIVKQSLPFKSDRHRSTMRQEQPLGPTTVAEKLPTAAPMHHARAHRADA